MVGDAMNPFPFLFTLVIVVAAVTHCSIEQERSRVEYKIECLRKGGQYSHWWGGNCYGAAR